MVFISKHSIDVIMNREGSLLSQCDLFSVEGDNMWQLEWVLYSFHGSKSFSWPVYVFLFLLALKFYGYWYT